MSYGWEIDPPWKAYEAWERWNDALYDEEEPEEPEYDHDEKMVRELEEA